MSTRSVSDPARSLGRGAVAGLGAWLLGYLVTYLLHAGGVRRQRVADAPGVEKVRDQVSEKPRPRTRDGAAAERASGVGDRTYRHVAISRPPAGSAFREWQVDRVGR